MRKLLLRVEVARRVGKWPTRLYGPLAYKIRYSYFSTLDLSQTDIFVERFNPDLIVASQLAQQFADRAHCHPRPAGPFGERGLVVERLPDIRDLVQELDSLCFATVLIIRPGQLCSQRKEELLEMYSLKQVPSNGEKFLNDLPPDELAVTDGKHQLPKHLANIVLLDFDACPAKYSTQDLAVVNFIDPVD